MLETLLMKLIGPLIKLKNRLFWVELEYISDDERVWRTVYNKYQIKKSGELKSSFFRDKNGLSCDLASYTTVNKAILGITDPPRPKYAGLVQFLVADIRSDDIASDIIHKPIKLNNKKNYAHCVLTTYFTQSQANKMKELATFKSNLM